MGVIPYGGQCPTGVMSYGGGGGGNVLEPNKYVCHFH